MYHLIFPCVWNMGNGINMLYKPSCLEIRAYRLQAKSAKLGEGLRNTICLGLVARIETCSLGASQPSMCYALASGLSSREREMDGVHSLSESKLGKGAYWTSNHVPPFCPWFHTFVYYPLYAHACVCTCVCTCM